MSAAVFTEDHLEAAMNAFDLCEKVTKRELCDASGLRRSPSMLNRLVRELKKSGRIVDAGVKSDPRNGVLRDAYRKMG